METITIQAFEQVATRTGKTYGKITATDGRTISDWDQSNWVVYRPGANVQVELIQNGIYWNTAGMAVPAANVNGQPTVRQANTEYPPTGSAPDREEAIRRAVALKAAVDVAIHNGFAYNQEGTQLKMNIQAAEVLNLAETFERWLASGVPF